MSSINLQLKLKKSEKFPLKYKVIKRYKERHSFIVGCYFNTVILREMMRIIYQFNFKILKINEM